MPGASVVISGLTKKFGEVPAVRGISLAVRAGEFLSMLGSSGSGKSTVLRLIAGLEEPQSGQVLIDGRDTTGLPPEARGIGMVFQDYALFPHMTVWQNVAFPLRMRRLPTAEIAAKVSDIMKLAGIEGLSARRPSQISGGQQQRVALARALVFDPKLLLLDEPLSALDKNLRDYMKGELKALHRRVGVTIIYVTHDQSEALALSDRVAVMRNGNIVDVDSPDRLYRLPSSRYIASFIGDANLIDGEVVRVDDGTVTVSSSFGHWRLPHDRVRTHGELAAGTPVTIVVRPENVAMKPAAGSGSLAVVCEITEALYNGSHTLYALRAAEAGITLRAQSNEEAGAILEPGTAATIGLFPDRSVVVDRPP